MIRIGKRTTVGAAMPDGRADVSGYVLEGTGGRFAVTRSVNPGRRKVWNVTHVSSGLRLPGHGFATREDAVRAVAAWVAIVPDALELSDRIGSGQSIGQDAPRLADGWRRVISVGASVALDRFAAVRREIRDRFGDWDSLSAQVLSDIGATEDGWDYSGDVLTCPHGHRIEDDGRCPSGCVSPFVAAGII